MRDANEYQQLAARTESDSNLAKQRIAESGLLAARLLHAALGMMTEVGEFADTLKRWLWYGQDLDRANLKEELGDAQWYSALAHNALELEMLDTMRANLAKLKQRYKDRYTDLEAREENRDRAAEMEKLIRGGPPQTEHIVVDPNPSPYVDPLRFSQLVIREPRR